MNYTNFIDSSQAHLPVQYTTNIELIRQKWLWCCDLQRATSSRTCKTSFLFAQLAARVQAGCSSFPFYTPTKPLIRYNFKYKAVLISKLKYFYILNIYKTVHEYFGSLAKLTWSPGFTFTLQETRSIHDSTNRSKIESISKEPVQRSAVAKLVER